MPQNHRTMDPTTAYNDRFRLAADFASANADIPCDRLLLNAAKWPDIDMRLVASTLEARRRLKGKVPEWASDSRLVFTASLPAEQCSSSLCARYKASLVRKLGCKAAADLTGGMGVDSWQLRTACSELHYFERNTLLAAATRYNFGVLGITGVTFSDTEITAANIMEEVIGRYSPDLIYIDPARRGRDGRRVFALTDYEPDIFTVKDTILRHCPRILVKISPMEDPDAIFRAVPECCGIHIVSTGNECKELLLVIDAGVPVLPPEQRPRTAVTIGSGGESALTLTKASEAAAAPAMLADISQLAPGAYIADPSRSVLKAGAYNTFAAVTSSVKLDPSTHLYLLPEGSSLPNGMARMFRIIDCARLDKQGIRKMASLAPTAEITAKNLPLDTEGLRRRMKTKAGGPYHIWGCRAAGENILILTEPVSPSAR